VHIYTDKTLFTEDITRNHYDIALVGGKYREAGQEAGARGIPVLILSDEMPDPSNDESQEIFRYQPIEGIIHKMQAVAAGGMIIDPGMAVFGRRLEVIGVYSPDRHEMQMPFSVVMAAALAEKSKVLYINLMEHSGFRELFGAEGACDMSDIILHLRANDLTNEIFMMSVYEVEGVSYIPPFANPGNLHELELGDLQALLEFIDTNTHYETIIFDFGEGFANFDRMLGVCGLLYCPTRRGYYYECCTNEFRNYLDKSVVQGLCERIKIVELPYSARSIRGGGDVFRQLLWSDFGDYVRGYLTGSGNEYDCKEGRECS
jgi:hypothetical protein